MHALTLSLRHFVRLTLGLLFLAVARPALAAPATPAPNRPPQEYIDRMNEVISSFSARDFDKTLQALDAAEKILPPTPLTLNTRGAVLIEQKKFAEGIVQCQAALKLSPRFYPARFNLAEASFMQGHYEASRAMFQKLLDENAKDELVQFRIMLTYLMEKKETEARQMLNHIPFPGDTAAYYYANAAWEFAHENPTEAQKWVARGNWVFPPQRTANFSDTLREIGWLKTVETTEKAAPRDNVQLESSAPETNPGIQLQTPAKP